MFGKMEATRKLFLNPSWKVFMRKQLGCNVTAVDAVCVDDGTSMTTILTPSFSFSYDNNIPTSSDKCGKPPGSQYRFD
jgi:hypothetical protein